MRRELSIMRAVWVAAVLVAMAAMTAPAATLSVGDHVYEQGHAELIEIPIHITPTEPGEQIGFLRIAHAIERAATGERSAEVEWIQTRDSGVTVWDPFVGTIWPESAQQFEGFADIPKVATGYVEPAMSVLGGLSVDADGVVINYLLDISLLQIGEYSLILDYEHEQAGFGGIVGETQSDLETLLIDNGSLFIVPQGSLNISEPSALVLSLLTVMIVSWRYRWA